MLVKITIARGRTNIPKELTRLHSFTKRFEQGTSLFAIVSMSWCPYSKEVTSQYPELKSLEKKIAFLTTVQLRNLKKAFLYLR